MPDTNTLQIVMRPIQGLRPHPLNYRRHDEGQVGVLAHSLTEHGLQRPVVITPDDMILAGHGLVMAARRLGWDEIACHVYEGDKPDAFLVMDNHSADLATDDTVALLAILNELNGHGHLGAAGYEANDLLDLISQISEDEQTSSRGEGGESPNPDLSLVTTQCQPGQVWRLGRHTLGVGNACDAGLVSRVLGDRRVRLIWTDPPYGVGYGQKEQDLREAGYGMGTHANVTNDSLTPEATHDLCRDALAAILPHALPGCAFYLTCPSGDLLCTFISAVNASGFTYKHGLVWVKQHFVFGRSDYHYRHEMMLYGWVESGAHYFTEDATQDSVFEIDRPASSPLHPTMKPVALIAKCLHNSSRPGEVVYDPFAGSGSTLMACEETGRVGVGIELEPHYADVILKRFSDATGLTPELEGDTHA